MALIVFILSLKRIKKHNPSPGSASQLLRRFSQLLTLLYVKGAKVRAANKLALVMAGLDPAIQVLLKDMCFLLLDGPIKSGHDMMRFRERHCPDFRPSYYCAA